MLTHFLLESPGALVFFLALTAIVLLLIASRHQGPTQRKSAAAAAAVALLAVGVWLLATLWVTDRERILQRTEMLLDLTAPLDAANLDQMFDPAAEMVGPDGQRCFDAHQMLRMLKSNLEIYRVTSHRVRRIGASVESSQSGTSWLELRTTLQYPAAGGTAPIPSSWILLWRREAPDGPWLVAQVKCTELMSLRPSCDYWR